MQGDMASQSTTPLLPDRAPKTDAENQNKVRLMPLKMYQDKPFQNEFLFSFWGEVTLSPRSTQIGTWRNPTCKPARS